MSESESSEIEASDIDEYVSLAYKKFTEKVVALEEENSESHVISLTPSVPFNSQDDTPKRNEETDTDRFVTTCVS